MKNLSFLVLLFSLVWGPTELFAQDNAAVDSVKVAQLLEAFTTSLQLDETQQGQVEEILSQTAQSLAGIRHLKSENIQLFRQQRRPIMQQMRQDMESVLDAEQQATFEAAMAQRQQNRSQKGKGKSASGRTGSQASGSTTTPLPVGAEVLSRSLDFLFEEVLTPTVRSQTQRP